MHKFSYAQYSAARANNKVPVFKILTIFFLLSLHIAPTYALGPGSCAALFQKIFSKHHLSYGTSEFGYGETILYRAKEKNLIPLEQKESFKIKFYNVFNLRISTPNRFTDPITGNVITTPRRLSKFKNRLEQARIIKEHQPDVVILAEVFGDEPLNRFTDIHLNNLYTPMLVSGNDERGAQIAFLIKKDLAIQAKVHSFKHYQMKYKGLDTPIFSRDFPVMEIRKLDDDPSDPPLMLIAATHLKSQRDSQHDPRSYYRRNKQVKAMLDIQKMFEEKYGRRIPFIIGGDFNNSLEPGNLAPEFRQMQRANLRDAFSTAKQVDLGECECRTTQTFHPQGGPTKYNQLDSFQVNHTIHQRQLILRAGIHRYRDQFGNELPLPRTIREREQNPSDHYPIWLELDIKRFLQRP